ncbi:MAG TPA: hypothetical protein VLA15_01175 [Desulfurivibrionaceae bacterium]|nr:hypothetical protein [Desulfurivibrionaceae bacterium]
MFLLKSVPRATLLALALMLAVGCATTPSAPPVEAGLAEEYTPEQDAVVKMERTPEQKTGIRIIDVRQASAGYMLDFRYVVEEPIRAKLMFDRATIPYLIHEASGARFMVPNPGKVGPLRATTMEPAEGNQYYIFFANPGRYVKPGDLVTVVMGNRRFEHLVVR